jgi:HJR/Mrr/RecB family endonuclease
MSRYHKVHKSHTSDVWFVAIVLLGAAFYQHKDLLPIIEHILLYLLVGISLITILIGSIRALKSTHRKQRFIYTANVDTMDGLEFEQYVAQLLMTRGYSKRKLTEKYDLGDDIIAEKDGVRWGIQVKRYSGLVGTSAVKQVVTALPLYKCERTMVITNSSYTKNAEKLATGNNCVLVGRDSLRRML